MGKRLDSNFKNMVLVLCAIALFSSLSVASIHALTAEKMNEVGRQKQLQAIRDVLPAFDNNPVEESDTLTTASGEILVRFPARRGGTLVGTAVKSFSNDGYSGQIWLMVGFSPDGTVYNYTVLEHKETPGLGSKMGVWFAKGNKGDVVGRNPGEKALRVKKDGGEIDAITAATISSRAFLNAVYRAADALAGKSVDATSGATGVEDAESGATDATSGATDTTSGATDTTSSATDTTPDTTDTTSSATDTTPDTTSGATEVTPDPAPSSPPPAN
jgi:electron transport complex protein RnfG